MNRFFVISPNVDGSGGKVDEFLKTMFEEHVTLMGWDNDNPKGQMFRRMDEGDYVICAQGANKNKRVFFAGKVSSNTYGEWPFQRKLSGFVDLRHDNIQFDEKNSYGASSQIPAIYELKKDVPSDKKICKTIKIKVDMAEKKESLENIVNLVKNNRNLILTGAPGTGKTFLAKEIARNMGAVGEQMEFVQFHPSYDYTDFVEGLRPKQDEAGNVGFERKDGVFIEFCKKALESRMIGGSDNFDEVWNNLLDYLGENTYIEIPLLTGTRNIRVELNEYGTGLTERLYSDDHSDGIGEKIPGHSKFFTKEQLHNVYRGEKGVPSGGHDNYRKAIIEYLKKNMGLVDFSAGQESTNAKTFVFIIDEINRGEISKIFGELFFSIDPGYRGEAGKVRTQYANMQTEPNVFDKSLGVTAPQNYGHFYVPDNVYIIGTMNDIDRSVESMDFAFRRRFAFKEILASENTGMLDNLNDDDLKNAAIRRMESLNKEIESCPGLNSSYHIGASYFLKLNNYKGDASEMQFEQLWGIHLEPLLREYLRGMPEADELLKKLRAAYEMESNE